MKDILAKLSQLEASAAVPAPQKKRVLKESAAPVQTKPATLKDVFKQLSEAIPPGAKPLPVMDPTNKKAGMGFVTSNNPAVQNMLKNLDPKDVQIMQAPGTVPGQPAQQTQQMQAQPAAAGATGQAPAGQTQMKEKFAGDVKLNPAKKGMFNGKTKADLEKQLSVLHKSGPHKKGSPEYTKQQELNFAIRAKGGWKKSVDEEQLDELSPEAKWDYADNGRKSVNDLAGKVGSATGQDANKLINKAIKRQNIVRKTERNLIDVDEAHTGDEAEKKFNKYNAQELDHMLDRAYGRSKPGDAHKQDRARQAKDAAYKIMWNKKYRDLDEADIAPTSGIDTDGAGLGAGRSNTTLEGKKAKKPDFLDLDKDGNKKETMKKAVVDKKKKSIKEGLAERIRAAHHQGKSHGLNSVTHSGKNYEDMEEARAYHQGYKEGLDECYGMGISQEPVRGMARETRMPATVHGMADQALDEGRGSYDSVMNAIRHRILRSHVDVVGKFGPGKIMAAIEDQAGHYDGIDLEEIGSSDVSHWVNNVIRDLESGHYDEIDESEMDEGNAFTGALAKTPRGGHFKVGGKTFTDTSNLDESDYAFEAWDRQLENLINEGLSVSISKDNPNTPDSVNVNATDQEADKLLALVKQAGMGIFGGDDGAEMSHAPVIGGASEINAPGEIEVVDDHDGMMSLIKRMSDIGGGNQQEDYDDGDYADEEEMSEAQCNECGMTESKCGCNEEVLDEVESEDQMEYEVAEANAPDSGADNSEVDVQGNAAANNALAVADAGQDKEDGMSDQAVQESDDDEDEDEDFFYNPKVPRDQQLPRSPKEINIEESFSFQNLYKKFAMLEAKAEKEDEKAEKAGKKVAKDIEYDEGHKGKRDNKAEKAGKKVTKDIEYDDKKYKKGKKLDEWANDAGPGKTVSDTTFEQDIEFMTKVISGGLNKQKSTGQTTVPVITDQSSRMRSHDTTDINESINDWKKLAGLR